jgi:hypothetical protein
VIACGIAGIMIGDRAGKGDIQSNGLCALGNLLAPIRVNFAGQINGVSHYALHKEKPDASSTGARRIQTRPTVAY